MNEYYYIAHRKPRGMRLRYVGDGLIQADSVKEAKELVAQIYKSPESQVSITFRKKIS